MRIRDPIHGFIEVDDFEKELINSKPFQRLRFIKQLSFTSYVYPGAEHTRFSHSLGVMEFSTQVYKSLTTQYRDKFKGDLGWTEEDLERNLRILRLTSLLHDIGHPPFSHASEGFFADGKGHEDYTCRIIRESEIADIIDQKSDDDRITSKYIANFFVKPAVRDAQSEFLRGIYDGDVDTDKMDYLLRDSHFTGASCGAYDYQRLIASLCLIDDSEKDDGNPRIGIKTGGVHALESLVLARYFMFAQVYFHPVVRAYGLHLEKFLGETGFQHPADIEEFIETNDMTMYKIIHDAVDNNHARAIIERNHFRLALGSHDHSLKQDHEQHYKLRKKIDDQGWTEGAHFLIDDASKSPHSFERKNFSILSDDGKIESLLTRSPIMESLKSVEAFSIHCHPEISDSIKELIRSL